MSRCGGQTPEAACRVRYYPELAQRLADSGENDVEYVQVGGLAVGHTAEELDPIVRRLEKYLQIENFSLDRSA